LNKKDEIAKQIIRKDITQFSKKSNKSELLKFGFTYFVKIRNLISEIVNLGGDDLALFST